MMSFHFQLCMMTLPLCWAVAPEPKCFLSIPPATDYTEDGNIVLGIVSPISARSAKPVTEFSRFPTPSPCALYRMELYKSLLALLFAVKEVNENPHLLPNITLGFQMYDSCFTEPSSLQAILRLTSGGGNYAPNYHCDTRPIPPAVIGDTSSSSLAIARILGLWRLPQVSFIAAVPSLSNKMEFPSFLRSSTSVKSQPQAVIELCKRFGWTWIGIYISSNDYFVQAATALRNEATKNGICIAFLEIVSFVLNQKILPATIEPVRKTKATVIVLYCSPAEASLILVEAIQQAIVEKLWISTEAWFTTPIFQQNLLWNTLNGTIGIARSRNTLPNFINFLQSLRPTTYPKMISIQQFWGQLFNCRWAVDGANSSQTCTGLEKIVTDDIKEFNDPTSQGVYMAHNALYAIAHALHNLLSCKPDEGPFAGNSCADKKEIKPWQLLYYLKRVEFVNTAGEEVSFDANGDIYGYFDILNWYMEANKTTGQYVKVGALNKVINTGYKLDINDSAIFWPGGPGKIPRSVCSDDCPPGYRKASQRGWPICCFDCVRCPEGMISNQTNSTTCFICPEDQWSNRERTKCVPKIIEFLSYEEPLGLVLTSFSLILSFTTMMILCVFLKFRNSVVVKANNRNLSYLLLLSLTFCFLCSLAFVGCPVRLTCTIRQSLFGLIFSLCISCVLAKTIIVVIAFKATKPGSNLRVWVGSQTAILIVVSSTCVQGIIIVVWLVRFPPFLASDYHVLSGVVLLVCNEGSVAMFYCTIGYLAFLAAVSFIVAFLARNLPDSFNEAKYITFSMLTFLSVWTTFIPAYLSTKGKYIVAVEIFAILLSSFGLLGCIFIPKCYIILLKPSMNTREYLMSKSKPSFHTEVTYSDCGTEKHVTNS